VFDPLRDFFLTFGTAGLLLWTVIKILAIALPLVCLVLVAGVLYWSGRRIVRFFRARSSTP
jgi:NADH-quinone oxidoreductase subunit H